MSKTDWPAEIYENISFNDLILVSFYQLTNDFKEVNFETLLQRCFERFPSKFKFINLPFPDARKLDRPLRSLRVEKLVKDGEAGLFCLTKTGEKRALEIINFLRQTKLKLK